MWNYFKASVIYFVHSRLYYKTTRNKSGAVRPVDLSTRTAKDARDDTRFVIYFRRNPTPSLRLHRVRTKRYQNRLFTLPFFFFFAACPQHGFIYRAKPVYNEYTYPCRRHVRDPGTRLDVLLRVKLLFSTAALCCALVTFYNDEIYRHTLADRAYNGVV